MRRREGLQRGRLGHRPSPGSPSALPRLSGWAGSFLASSFPNWWVAPSRARPFNPGAWPRGERLRPCPAGGVPAPPRFYPRGRSAGPRLRRLRLCLSRDRGPVRALWEAPGAQIGRAYPRRRPWRAPWTWTRAARWRSCSVVASKPLVSGTGGHTQPEPGPLPPWADLGHGPTQPASCSLFSENLPFIAGRRGPHAAERENVILP